MKTNKEIEALFKESLKDNIEELESTRIKLITKANRLKSYLLIVLLGFLVVFYFENFYLYFEYSRLEVDLGFAIFAISLLVGYIYLKPESLVSEKNTRLFYRMAKINFFQKCINSVDPRIKYSPVYKTHISHIKKCGFWSGNYTIAKEEDGLFFSFSNMNARLSKLKIYRSTKKVFSGVFIKVDFNTKEFICENELSENIIWIKNKIEKDFKLSIRQSNIDSSFYFALDFNREWCEVKLSSKKEVSFDNIKEDLMMLYNLIFFVNSISDRAVQSQKSNKPSSQLSKKIALDSLA